MNKNLKFLSVAILVIAIAGAYVFPQVQEQARNVLGAVSNLDGVDNPFVSINGQREWNGTVSMAATSTVVCSIANPFTATSSIEYLSAEVLNRGGMGQTNSLSVSTSTGQFSTSTTALVMDFAMGSGQFSMALQKNSATSTAGASNTWGTMANLLPGLNARGTSNYVLGPSDRVNFVVASTSPGGGSAFTTYMTGKCSAVFKKI